MYVRQLSTKPSPPATRVVRLAFQSTPCSMPSSMSRLANSGWLSTISCAKYGAHALTMAIATSTLTPVLATAMLVGT